MLILLIATEKWGKSTLINSADERIQSSLFLITLLLVECWCIIVFTTDTLFIGGF